MAEIKVVTIDGVDFRISSFTVRKVREMSKRSREAVLDPDVARDIDTCDSLNAALQAGEQSWTPVRLLDFLEEKFGGFAGETASVKLHTEILRLSKLQISGEFEAALKAASQLTSTNSDAASQQPVSAV